MDKKLQDKLFKKHESFFKYHGKNTLICGLEIDNGWYNLVDELCEELNTINKKYNITIIAIQIKEKFGLLRFYYYFSEDDKNKKLIWENINKEILSIINKYVNKSETICESCGCDGTKDNTGWIKVLCEQCRQKNKGLHS